MKQSKKIYTQLLDFGPFDHNGSDTILDVENEYGEKDEQKFFLMKNIVIVKCDQIQ